MKFYQSYRINLAKDKIDLLDPFETDDWRDVFNRMEKGKRWHYGDSGVYFEFQTVEEFCKTKPEGFGSSYLLDKYLQKSDDLLSFYSGRHRRNKTPYFVAWDRHDDEILVIDIVKKHYVINVNCKDEDYIIISNSRDWEIEKHMDGRLDINGERYNNISNFIYKYKVSSEMVNMFVQKQ